MTRFSRRQFIGCASAATLGPVASAAQRFIGGVEVGVQSWCFNDRPFDEMVVALRAVGTASVELWSGHVEPLRKFRDDREALRRWRLEIDLDHFRRVRRTLDDHNIQLSAFNISIRNNWTDEEIDRAFQMARALGTGLITSSSNISTAARINPFAQRYKIRVAFHNHARIKPDEFATPEDFRKGLEGFSDYLGINLDTGHFTAASLDPLAFVREHHQRIWSLHMKDRTTNDGPKVPFGEGDTPLREILLTLKRNQWKIPAHVEFAYPTADPVAEAQRNLRWMKEILETQ